MPSTTAPNPIHTHTLGNREDGLAYCIVCRGGEVELEETCETRVSRERKTLLAQRDALLAALEQASEVLAHYLTGPDKNDPALNRAFNKSRAAIVLCK